MVGVSSNQLNALKEKHWILQGRGILLPEDFDLAAMSTLPWVSSLLGCPVVFRFASNMGLQSQAQLSDLAAAAAVPKIQLARSLK